MCKICEKYAKTPDRIELTWDNYADFVYKSKADGKLYIFDKASITIAEVSNSNFTVWDSVDIVDIGLSVSIKDYTGTIELVPLCTIQYFNEAISKI